MIRSILLARHGSHDELGRVLSGRCEIGLNAAGLVEAEVLAGSLRGMTLRSVHASPRERTMATADPVARDHRLPTTVAPALDEIDFGRFAGQKFAALEPDPDWRAWNERRDTARCPGGETMAEAAGRALAYLRAIPAGAAPALCVTHCDIIRGVVAAASGRGFDRLWEMPCDPGCVTELALDGAAIRVVALNRRPGSSSPP